MHEKTKISYEPLWQTMRNRGVSTYDLTIKRGFNKGTLYRIERGENVNISTIAELCMLLDCQIEEVVRIEFKKEDK